MVFLLSQRCNFPTCEKIEWVGSMKNSIHAFVMKYGQWEMCVMEGLNA